MGYLETYRDVIDRNISAYENKCVFSYLIGSGTVNISYREFGSYLRDMNKTFASIKLEAGDRVAVISSTTESSVALCTALMYSGLVIVPIDINLPLQEKNRLLKLAEVKALFLQEKYLDGLVTDDMSVYVLLRGLKCRDHITCVKAPEYEKSAPYVSAIMFSSGTTGTVKGVEIRREATLTALKLLMDYTKTTCDDNFLNVLPISHVAGYLTSLAIAWVGCKSSYIDSFDGNNLMKAFLIYNPTEFELVPEIFELMKKRALTMINRNIFVKLYYKLSTAIVRSCRMNLNFNPSFLTKPFTNRMFGKNIRYIAGGAAPFSEELIRFYLDLGIVFGNVYGSTETFFPVTAYDSANMYEYKGVGTYNRYKEVKVKINNPDENGMGEIFVKSELIMNGYFKEPELTKDAFEDDWFKTGDLGVIDENGVLFVKGRMKENIVLQNGEKITPSELDAYYSYENVRVASVGVMTEKGYDEVHLFVESKDEKLMEIMNERCRTAAKNYRVKQVHMIDKLPVTTIGKVKRHELRGYVNATSGVGKGNN